MVYKLVAQNVYGANTTLYADTIKAVTAKFDSQYMRKGFRIWIYQHNGHEYVGRKIIKSSYR